MLRVRRWLRGLGLTGRAWLGLMFLACLPAQSATVLVLRFHNASDFPDLNWVGESVSEVLSSEISGTNLIVIDRDTRSEAMKRLSLRAEADFTKATIIRLGQALDADFVIYGSYTAKPDPATSNELRNSLLDITGRVIDLRHLHDGPDVSEAGRLADLARLEEHLAWANIKFLDPSSNPKIEDFLTARKIIRVDAQESYVRGLLSANRDQRQKWFMQAVIVDASFISPSFELGKLLLDKKDYRGRFWRCSESQPRTHDMQRRGSAWGFVPIAPTTTTPPRVISARWRRRCR